MEKSISSRSERPEPRGSYQMRRNVSASVWKAPEYIAQSRWTWANPGVAMRTRGGPSPMLAKAMLTPSAVWAYWMRGSIAGLSPLRQHRVGVQVLDGGDGAVQHRRHQRDP